MDKILTIIAVVLLLFWAVGFFIFSMGAILHLLLVFAVIAVLLKIIQDKNVL